MHYSKAQVFEDLITIPHHLSNSGYILSATKTGWEGTPLASPQTVPSLLQWVCPSSVPPPPMVTMYRIQIECEIPITNTLYIMLACW